MRTFLKTTLCVLVISTSLNAFAQQSTIKDFKGIVYEGDMITTKDGGYAICGSGISVVDNYHSVQYIYKLDSNYNQQWATSVGYSGYETANTILQLKDGGFIVFGRMQSTIDGNTDKYFLAVRLSAGGSVIWSRNYVSSMFGIDSHVYDAIALNDTTFIVAGKVYGNNITFRAAKITISGTLLWDKIFSIGNGSAEMGALARVDDTSFVVTGTTGLRNKPQPYTVNINNSGDVKWAKKYSSSFASNAGGIVKYGKTYFMTGSIDSSAMLLKIDEAGDVQASGKIGGNKNDYGSGILIANDGNIVIAGKTNSYSTGAMDAYFIKLKKTGALLWSATTAIGNTAGLLSFSERANGNFTSLSTQFNFDSIGQNKIIELTGNGIICNAAASGATISRLSVQATSIAASSFGSGTAMNGPTQQHNIVMALQTSCSSVAKVQDIIAINLAEQKPNTNIVYPNPVKDIMHIKVNKTSDIILTDASGKIILRKTINGTTDINTSHYAAGLYYLINKTTGVTNKIIITR